jgi:hypothetical protein
MIANSITFFVFNRKFYIPTPATYSGDGFSSAWEPVAIVDFGDFESFANAVKERLFNPKVTMPFRTWRDLPKGKHSFVVNKYTKHKSDTDFVRNVDRWVLGALTNGSADLYLSLWDKKGRGYVGSKHNIFQFSAQELTGKEMELFSNLAKQISHHYKKSDL